MRPIIVSYAGRHGVQGNTDGRHEEATFRNICAACMGPNGCLLIADEAAVRRIQLNGVVETIASRCVQDIHWSIKCITIGPDSRIYVATTDGVRVACKGELIVGEYDALRGYFLHYVEVTTEGGLLVIDWLGKIYRTPRGGGQPEEVPSQDIVRVSGYRMYASILFRTWHLPLRLYYSKNVEDETLQEVIDGTTVLPVARFQGDTYHRLFDNPNVIYKNSEYFIDATLYITGERASPGSRDLVCLVPDVDDMYIVFKDCVWRLCTNPSWEPRTHRWFGGKTKRVVWTILMLRAKGQPQLSSLPRELLGILFNCVAKGVQ